MVLVHCDKGYLIFLISTWFMMRCKLDFLIFCRVSSWIVGSGYLQNISDDRTTRRKLHIPRLLLLLRLLLAYVKLAFLLDLHLRGSCRDCLDSTTVCYFQVARLLVDVML